MLDHLCENVLFIVLFCLYLNNDISRMSSNHFKHDIVFIMNSCEYMSLQKKEKHSCIPNKKRYHNVCRDVYILPSVARNIYMHCILQ